MARRFELGSLVTALALAAPSALAQAAPPVGEPEAPAPARAPAPAAEEEPGDTNEAPPPPPATATRAPSAPSVAPAPAPVPGYSPWAITPPGAPNAPPPQADKPEEPLPPAGPPRWQGVMGVRSMYVKNAGFDPFSSDDALVQGSFGLSRSIFKEAPLSFAGALWFDFGSKSAAARGAPTKLDTYRLLAGPEIRWHLLPELYLFVRPSAGVTRTSASLEEAATGVSLYSRAWLFSADADAGAAFAFWDLRTKSSDLRFWLVADGGYSWTQSQKLSMEADPNSGAPQRPAAVDLGELMLGGPYFRVALAASF